MSEPTRRRWGRAGERLDPVERETRRREISAAANRSRTARQADDQVAYRRWREGLVVPYLITLALDQHDLHGPEVDAACLAREPEVDQWEAGERYPSWWQLRALAELTGSTARFFTKGDVQPLQVHQTSMWFHMTAAERRAYKWTPPVMRFPRAVLDARPPSPAVMPDDDAAPTTAAPLTVPLLPDEGDQLSLFSGPAP